VSFDSPVTVTSTLNGDWPKTLPVIINDKAINSILLLRFILIDCDLI